MFHSTSILPESPTHPREHSVADPTCLCNTRSSVWFPDDVRVLCGFSSGESVGILAGNLVESRHGTPAPAPSEVVLRTAPRSFPEAGCVLPVVMVVAKRLTGGEGVIGGTPPFMDL